MNCGVLNQLPATSGHIKSKQQSFTLTFVSKQTSDKNEFLIFKYLPNYTHLPWYFIQGEKFCKNNVVDEKLFIFSFYRNITCVYKFEHADDKHQEFIV